MVEASENRKPSYGLPSASKASSTSAPPTRPIAGSAWMTSSGAGSMNNDAGPRVWGDQASKGKNKAATPFTAYDPSRLAQAQYRPPSTNTASGNAYGRLQAQGRRFPLANNSVSIYLYCSGPR